MSHFEKCCQNNWREERKKGPPLTLHTPGFTAFVLGRIMLFDSADRGKTFIFQVNYRKKSILLNVKNRGEGAAVHHSYFQLPNFRTRHKLTPTVSLSKPQFKGKEDKTAPAKVRITASRVFSNHNASICSPKASTKL